MWAVILILAVLRGVGTTIVADVSIRSGTATGLNESLMAGYQVVSQAIELVDIPDANPSTAPAPAASTPRPPPTSTPRPPEAAANPSYAVAGIVVGGVLGVGAVCAVTCWAAPRRPPPGPHAGGQPVIKVDLVHIRP